MPGACRSCSRAHKLLWLRARLGKWFFYSGHVLIIPPASTKLIGGYTGITLSVCPSVDRIVSALYLQQYSSDPFHICTSYQATSEGVSRVMPVSKLKNLKFWRIFEICNFDFVIFWLGIQYDSMVWVIMRRRGVSSERRRSSCSSFPSSIHKLYRACTNIGWAPESFCRARQFSELCARWACKPNA